tara:strand:+ start:1512 stop:1712 length:201 start_codon:yes stop_codon:yes gene_type:complete
VHALSNAKTGLSIKRSGGTGNEEFPAHTHNPASLGSSPTPMDPRPSTNCSAFEATLAIESWGKLTH